MELCQGDVHLKLACSFTQLLISSYLHARVYHLTKPSCERSAVQKISLAWQQSEKEGGMVVTNVTTTLLTTLLTILVLHLALSPCLPL